MVYNRGSSTTAFGRIHENLESLAYGAGIPQAVVDLTIAVPVQQRRRDRTRSAAETPRAAAPA